MADISKITLPSGTQYDIKDATARELIDQLNQYTDFLGVTTTALTDGATTNPIKINGEDVTAKKGNITSYESKEFIFSGTAWQEFGDLSGLGSLAYKNSATGNFTPAGTVSQPAFTGSSSDVNVTVAANASGNYTPAGTVSQPTFTGSPMSASGTFTPSGNVSLTKTNKTATVSKAASGTATYTPEGSVSVTVTPSTASVTPIATVGTLPSCTLPSLSATVANENLTLGWTAGSFNAGSLPTKGTDVTVATGIQSATGSFTGTGARLVTGNISTADSATFTGTEASVGVTGTPEGTVSQPTFSGTKVKISGTTTANGSVSQPTFSGTQGTVTVS